MITVGIPTNRQLRTSTVLSLLQLKTRRKLQYVIETEGFTVEDNRNKIAEQALNSTHLLFIDDDMVFEPDLLDRLVALKKDIVGVNSKNRQGGQTVILEGIRSRPVPHKPFAADVVGTGIMLINTKVLKQLPKPWFKMEREKDGKVKTGEDAYFCLQAKKAGFEVWCDPTVYVGHIGEKTYE